MNLRFTDHARQRMAQRMIDEAEVTEVLSSPMTTEVEEDDPGRSMVTGATPAGRVLMVVVTGRSVVITVFERRAAPRR